MAASNWWPKDRTDVDLKRSYEYICTLNSFSYLTSPLELTGNITTLLCFAKTTPSLITNQNNNLACQEASKLI